MSFWMYGIWGTIFAAFGAVAVFLAGLGILLGLVAILASLIPARRAAQVDPMVPLLYE